MNLGKPVLEDLLNKQIRFKIPVFQRHYVWNKQDQWKPLWDDFINKFNERLTLDKKKFHPHYTGSIVLFQENTSASTLPIYNVIDGQQRLTTFQLLITAFREVCRKHLNDESLINELDKFLFNEKSFGDKDYENQKFKLEPTKFNKDIFKSILNNTYEEVDKLLILPVLNEYGVGHKTYRLTAIRRSQILGAYIFFYDQLDAFIEESELELTELITKILIVLKRDFQFVEIDLLPNDDPQMIFETMNGRGASLSETDLIRNYIFMRANSNEEDLDSIYEAYWNEFDDPETDFKWHKKTSRGRYNQIRLQFFIIDYLTLKLRSEIRNDQVFYYYKLFIINGSNFENVEEELKELNRYSKIFKKLTNPTLDNALGKLTIRLRDMEISTIYPLLLCIEGDEEITQDNKDNMYSILDSYVTRRFICGLTPKNYNNVFLEYLKFLTNNKEASQLEELLKSKTADSNLWPTDVMLSEKVIERPIYREASNRSKSLSNILLEIEKFQRGKKQEQIQFLNTDLTIEHVLPQKWFENWPLNGTSVIEDDFVVAQHAVMTEEDKEGKYHLIMDRNRLLHTFGNLTILTSALNPSVSNASFPIKKEKICSQSTLIINQYFQSKEEWNEEEITIRSKSLFKSISQIWKY